MQRKTTNFACLLFSMFVPISAFCSTLIDLEKEFKNDIVIETKRIVIPEYPLAFNPGIIRWKGSLLMSFKVIPDRKSSYTSNIGVVWLNDDFSLKGKPQLLAQRDASSEGPSRAEDARMVQVQDRVYVVYSDNEEKKISKGGYRVYVAELRVENDAFVLAKPERLAVFEGESQNLREKNWVPFAHDGDLLLAYTLCPHKILRPLLGQSEKCETTAITENAISWRWGELRGGTPALLVGNEYLAFFHSSIQTPTVHSEGKNVWHYFIGAYTFAPEAPFAISRASETPIVGENFYHGIEYKPYWKPVKAVFPCGYVFDDEFIWMSYGRDDHELWIAKLDKSKLLQSLVPVANKS